MAKVYGIHEIELYAEVSEESFKKFFTEFAKLYEKESGWKVILLKGDRGQRAGKYALMYEIKSVKERDRFAPAHNESSEELDHWYEEHKEMAEDWSKKWASFSPTDTGAHEEYTDYIKLA
jgi:hypothetical protein